MLGKLGETFAAELLAAQGYRILEKNFRCGLGEIDLIAEKNDEIVFVEVKTRRSDRFGCPAESVTREKQRHMKRTAEYYLITHDGNGRTVQFQVVEILCNQIHHAFT